MRYLALLRGVNVGGKNKISMPELRSQLEAAGFDNVSTYINSGNVLLESDQPAESVARKIESIIKQHFSLDSKLIKAGVFDLPALQTVVDDAPHRFGSKPEAYHSDVLFPLDGATSADIIAATETNPEVDKAWEMNGVVYYRRVSALRARSRLSKIIGKPVYKDTTIRSWNTTIKLLSLLADKK